MKILKLTAENFKKLSAVEITPDGNVVVISGKNEAGKSSVLNAIEAALCGGRGLPKQPIKTGEHRAKVETELGEKTPQYKVTRKFLGTNSTLKVEAIGEHTIAEVRSPQAFLDGIVGSISFDPLAFMKKSPAEQRQVLMDFLGINVADFDNKIIQLKEERSAVRREKERKLHEADSLQFTPNLPEKEQGADALLAELQAIREHNTNIQTLMSANAVTTSRIETATADIVAAKKAIEDWTKRLENLKNTKVELERQLQTAPQQKDSAEVEAKIKALGEINEKIRANQQKKAASRSYDEACEKYRSLGEQVKQVEGQKARKMAEAAMPVAGLTIQSDGLAFNELPLEQECDSRKLKICVAIAMAMNPKLKVLRINGNELDNDSLKAIGELVGGKDYQIWIEKVSDDNTIGFYIEDGTLMGNQNENTV